MSNPPTLPTKLTQMGGESSPSPYFTDNSHAGATGIAVAGYGTTPHANWGGLDTNRVQFNHAGGRRKRKNKTRKMGGKRQRQKRRNKTNKNKRHK